MTSGDMLCVLRDERSDGSSRDIASCNDTNRNDEGASWSVWLCSSNRHRERVQQFDKCSEAIEFAVAEEARRSKELGHALALSLPDDCPCYSRWHRRRSERKAQS